MLLCWRIFLPISLAGNLLLLALYGSLYSIDEVFMMDFDDHDSIKLTVDDIVFMWNYAFDPRLPNLTVDDILFMRDYASGKYDNSYKPILTVDDIVLLLSRR